MNGRGDPAGHGRICTPPGRAGTTLRTDIHRQSRQESVMSSETVLISGGGIAGCTLAYWLARHGLRVTLVERAASVRSSGSPVDVRGPAARVAERMGVMKHIREASTGVEGLSFVDGTGRQVARVRLPQADSGKQVELPRGDLGAILYEAGRESAEFLFDDSIAGLEQDAHGVDVTFERAAPRRFGLVVGTDGLHSTVRRLVFGPESRFVRHMGLYAATTPADGALEHDRRSVLMYNTPGKAVTVSPARTGALAFFVFRSPEVADFDHRDTAQHKRLLAGAYADAGWRVPELLERVRATDELYFDSVSQVRLGSWSRGRVTLLGDAASCVSLFGDGSSLAMAGACTLAERVAAHPGEHAVALAGYEAAHRKLVMPRQRFAAVGARWLVPATRYGIRVRNLSARW
ncbi:FAD-dependent oxidoreductase [Streptomyces sp. NPDC048275]|uniref:FAD-dependent oxidoreductase n=1 Tax=Streptomyces sp. NPDC048275 TaxID=3155629 RepID=UPI0033D1C888